MIAPKVVFTFAEGIRNELNTVGSAIDDAWGKENQPEEAVYRLLDPVHESISQFRSMVRRDLAVDATEETEQ